MNSNQTQQETTTPVGSAQNLQNNNDSNMDKILFEDDWIMNENIGELDNLKEFNILNMQETEIINVWKYNFEEEIEKISMLIQKYNVIAMDTEFPGITIYPTGTIEESDYEYQLIKENVRKQKIIQIGISIADENGNVPEGISTWQFNFCFDEDNDHISKDSKILLKNAGIDFPKFKQDGLQGDEFAELLIGSDIVMNEDITWIAFHGGFDFGYFLQMLYGGLIPDSSFEFYQKLHYFFPKIFDLKYIIKDLQRIKDFGLQKLSTELKVERRGPQHQAGSDSLLTLATYFKLREVYGENGTIQFESNQNIIFGLGKGFQGSKDKDYLSNYRMMSQNSEQQQYHDMHMPYMQQHNQYMYYDPNFQNPQMHGQYMHPQYQWMQQGLFQPMMPDDGMSQPRHN